jgi:hypothetical protein
MFTIFLRTRSERRPQAAGKCRKVFRACLYVEHTFLTHSFRTCQVVLATEHNAAIAQQACRSAADIPGRTDLETAIIPVEHADAMGAWHMHAQVSLANLPRQADREARSIQIRQEFKARQVDKLVEVTTVVMCAATCCFVYVPQSMCSRSGGLPACVLTFRFMGT